MTLQTTVAPRAMSYDVEGASTQAPQPREQASVRRRRDRRDYWVIFAVCLVFFLVAASIARVLRAIRITRFDASRSIWAEAKEEATLCTAAAFQG
jgi:membrane protein required for beta-lactamase induction